MTAPRPKLPATLADWLELLVRRHPREIDLGLERVAAVAYRLGLQRPARAVVTVAGTNGKGSCVATMEALLIANGRRVGSYTSPHLLVYNERIRIDGEMVADDDLCGAFERIEAARENVSLTYFEFGTLAALLLMEAAELDVALLEVGLGGRLDAVNIVDADVAVITSIALDHEGWLGHTRDAIGTEKAGIARAGVPLVCGDLNPPDAMVDYCDDLGARCRYLGDQDFVVALDLANQEHGFQLRCRARSGDAFILDGLPLPSLPYPSVACAVQALLELGEPISAALLRRVLSQLTLAGRFQQLCWAGRALILDVAHNPAAAQWLAERLTREFADRTIVAVFAALADKDIDGLVAPLCARVEHWYLGGLADVPRAADPLSIATTLYNRGANASCHESIAAGFFAALDNALGADVVLVFGSFHTVSAVLNLCLGEDALHA